MSDTLVSSTAPPRPAPPAPSAPRVLLTGATGFVGRYVYPVLEAAGCPVRCATRKVSRARRTAPDRDWVALDVDQPDTLAPALDGCDAAIYLVQDDAGDDDAARAIQRAEAFRQAAEAARLQRLVYVGCMAPFGPASPHVAGRIAVGETLRAGRVSAVEVRTGMILGAGGTTWQMMSDLAARLPAMFLPRWVQHRSWPVAIEDVALAVLTALRLPDAQAGCYDLPGPEGLSHRLVLERVAAQLGAHPPMWPVPLAMPGLSSLWVAMVTRVGLTEARRLVAWLRSDLDPTCHLLWEHVPGHRGMSLEEATAHALVDEHAKVLPSPRSLTALRALGHAHGWHPAPAA
jgi:uncharacterized protein YbjT (DUF2867 family)